MARKDDQKLIPALSKLPPNRNSNKEKYFKCMLLLFKPFDTFAELYNGISWKDSYETTDFASPFVDYIANIQEMHIGIQERQENSDDNDNTENDVLDESDELDIDPDQSIDVTDNG